MSGRSSMACASACASTALTTPPFRCSRSLSAEVSRGGVVCTSVDTLGAAFFAILHTLSAALPFEVGLVGDLSALPLPFSFAGCLFGAFFLGRHRSLELSSIDDACATFSRILACTRARVPESESCVDSDFTCDGRRSDLDDIDRAAELARRSRLCRCRRRCASLSSSSGTWLCRDERSDRPALSSCRSVRLSRKLFM